MFKDVFVHILQERNISAYKLSKDTGITQGMISYWKTGERTPSAESLNILADYLNCSVDYLLGRDGQQKKPTPKEGSGLDDVADVALEQEFMRWFRAQSPGRQKEVLFDLAKAVAGHDE